MVEVNRMLPISQLGKERISNIKMIVFDVDGVMVPRGTKIKQEGDLLMLDIKKIPLEQIEQVKKLYELGFHLNISSGRGLYMLQNMFREILPYVSLTFENGSATWYRGKIIQHVNSFEVLKDLNAELVGVRHERIRGIEPKELIITIHCDGGVEEVENIAGKFENVYCLWNGEAYDFGVRELQTKEGGIMRLRDYLGIGKESIIGIGDNYNDVELLREVGISVSADRGRLKGDYFISWDMEKLPAYYLMERILGLVDRGEGVETGELKGGMEDDESG